MRATLDKRRFGPWALVTGASSGIGKEFARQIAASGIHVALVARRETLLRTVGAECTRASGVQHLTNSVGGPEKAGVGSGAAQMWLCVPALSSGVFERVKFS
jgi:NAD(P)-dependent dehydrogenase (short-subunit alcohol dehydrogenase family)